MVVGNTTITPFARMVTPSIYLSTQSAEFPDHRRAATVAERIVG